MQAFLNESFLAIQTQARLDFSPYPIFKESQFFEKYRDQFACVDKSLIDSWLLQTNIQDTSKDVCDLAEIEHSRGVKLHCHAHETQNYSILYDAIEIYRRSLKLWQDRLGKISAILTAQNNIAIAYETLASQGIDSQQNHINSITELQIYIKQLQKNGSLREASLAYTRLAKVYYTLAKNSGFNNWKTEVIESYEKAILLQKENSFSVDELNSLHALDFFFYELITRDIEIEENCKRILLISERGIELSSILEEKNQEFSLTYYQAEAYRRLSEYSSSSAEKYLLESINLFSKYLKFAEEKQNKHYINCVQYSIGSSYLSLSYCASSNLQEYVEKSLESYKAAFQNCITSEESARPLEGIGKSYSRLADFGIEPEENSKRAIKVVSESVRIHEESETLKARLPELYKSLGLRHQKLSDLNPSNKSPIHESICLYQKSLAMSKEYRNDNNIAHAHMCLCSAYSRLSGFGNLANKEELDKSILHGKESYELYKQSNQSRMSLDSLEQLSFAYYKKYELDIDPEVSLKLAISTAEEALEISKLISNILIQAKSERQLGSLYQKLSNDNEYLEENIKKSISFFSSAFSSFSKIGLLREASQAKAGEAQTCLSLAKIVDYETWSLKAVAAYKEATLLRNENNFDSDELNSIYALVQVLFERQIQNIKSADSCEDILSIAPRGIELSQKLHREKEENYILYRQAEAYRVLAQYKDSDEEKYKLESIRLFSKYLIFAEKQNDKNRIYSAQYSIGCAYLDLSNCANSNLLEYVRKSITFYESSLVNCVTSQDRGLTLLAVGKSYGRLADFGIEPQENLKQSIEKIDRAIKIAEEENGLKKRLPEAYKSLGLKYQKLFNYESSNYSLISKSIQLYSKSLTLSQSLQNIEQIAHSHLCLCSIYTKSSEHITSNRRKELEKSTFHGEKACYFFRHSHQVRMLSESLEQLSYAYENKCKAGINVQSSLKLSIIKAQESWELSQSLSNPSRQGRLAFQLASLHKELASTGKESISNLLKAIDYLKSANFFSSEIKDLENQHRIYDLLGTVHSRLLALDVSVRENFKNSIESFNLSIDIAKSRGANYEIPGSISNRGLAYYRMAQKVNSPRYCKRAIKDLNESIKLCDPDSSGLSNTLSSLGAAYRLQGDLLKSYPFYQKAIASYRESLKLKKPEISPKACIQTASNLGNLGYTLAWWDVAVEGLSLLTEAVQNLRYINDGVTQREEILRQYLPDYERLAVACLKSGYVEKAVEVLEEVRSKYVLDSMLLVQLDNGVAFSNLEGNLAEIEKIQAEINKLYSLAIEIEELDLKSVELSDELEQIIDLDTARENDGNSDSSEFNSPPSIDQGENNNLETPQHSNLVSSGTLVHPEEDKASSPIPGNLTRFLSRWREVPEDILPQLQKLEAKKQELKEKINSYDPAFSQLAIGLDFSIKALQKNLIVSQKTAMINLYTTSKETFIFVITKDKVESFSCEKESQSKFQDWLRATWVGSYRAENLEKWRAKLPDLLQKISQRLQLSKLIETCLGGVDELIIIPHQTLHLVPFSALPIQTSQEADMVLGDRFIIRYAPNCKILELCEKNGSSQSTTEISSSLQRYVTIEDTADDLPFSRIEGDLLAGLYEIPQGDRFKGGSATPKVFHSALEKYQVILCSHHAQARLDKPDESSLIFANGERVTLLQLMLPHWNFKNLDEVFLACCETSLMNPKRNIDEVLTLGTGFLCAGAKNVISAFWAVDDLAAALFSWNYHFNRYSGLTVAKAMQTAQQTLRKMTGEQLEHWRDNDLMPRLILQKEQLQNEKEVKIDELEQREEYCYDELEVLKEEHRSCNNSDLGAELALRIKEAETRLNQITQQKLSLEKRIEKSLQRIESATSHLDELCQKLFPFESPYYWAAFRCEGAG